MQSCWVSIPDLANSIHELGRRKMPCLSDAARQKWRYAISLFICSLSLFPFLLTNKQKRTKIMPADIQRLRREISEWQR